MGVRLGRSGRRCSNLVINILKKSTPVPETELHPTYHEVPQGFSNLGG